MTQLKIGSAAIHFTLPGVDGRMHSLADYGHYVALGLVFTCNGCQYAQAWEGRLLGLHAEFAGAGVQFLLINPSDPLQHPDESFVRMAERASAHGYPFPYLADEAQDIARAYGVTHTPEVFLFDHSRRLRYHGAVDDSPAGADSVRLDYLREAIKALLGGYPVPFARTPPLGSAVEWRRSR